MRVLASFVLFSLVSACGSASGDAATSTGGEGSCYVESVDGEEGCWTSEEEACVYAQCDDCTCTEASSRNSCTCGGNASTAADEAPESDSAASAAEPACYIVDVQGNAGCWTSVEDACASNGCGECTCTEAAAENSCSCRDPIP